MKLSTPKEDLISGRAIWTSKMPSSLPLLLKTGVLLKKKFWENALDVLLPDAWSIESDLGSKGDVSYRVISFVGSKDL